jgi:hypothetical protein
MLFGVELLFAFNRWEYKTELIYAELFGVRDGEGWTKMVFPKTIHEYCSVTGEKETFQPPMCTNNVLMNNVH